MLTTQNLKQMGIHAIADDLAKLEWKGTHSQSKYGTKLKQWIGQEMDKPS